MHIGAEKAALFLCTLMNGNPGAACPHTQDTTARTDIATYWTSKLENWVVRLLGRRSSNCGNAETLRSLSTFPVYAISLSLSLSFHPSGVSLFLFQTRCYRCTYNKDVLDYPVCVNAIRCSSWGEGSSMWSIATRTPMSPEGLVSPQTENQLL